MAKFWASVKKNKLNDPPVLNYPPHVSLTGFFPGNATQEEEYIAALRHSIDHARPISVKIASKTVQQGPKLDYIPISSPDLLTVTTDFVKLIGVSSNFIKGKPKTFGYHISLRNDTNEKTTSAVRKLEAQFIHLNAKNIKKTTWAVYLYRKVNNQLEELVKIPVSG